MQRFEDISGLPDDKIDLLLGATLIAKDVYPALDHLTLAAKLDDLARPLLGAGLEKLAAADQAARLGQYLYVDLGFRGNQDDYYDPRNSLLPDVIERRVGIPITLALVYIEIARRARVDATGVCFPGHFLVRIERNADAGEAPGALLIDPFHAGRLLGEDDLVRMLKRVPGENELRPEHTAPASPRAILVRMLVNLKAVHFSRGDYARAHLVLDRIVSLTPDSVMALKARATLAAKLGAVESARADLARVLELEPYADDVQATKDALARLKKAHNGLN